MRRRAKVKRLLIEGAVGGGWWVVVDLVRCGWGVPLVRGRRWVQLVQSAVANEKRRRV